MKTTTLPIHILALIAGILLGSFMMTPQPVVAQKKITFDESLFNKLEYRSIGPYRGGRSAAVTGIPGDPMTYYFGGAGGGVWETTNGGQTWQNISDGFFGGSIGAIAVSEWDRNVIYVGGGEVTVRGNVSHGYGMWKTEDAGKSWKQVGLQNSRRIPRIRIHPKNPDLVYAAVLGHLFGPSSERGIFRSKDGGKSWQKILFVSDKVGAVDLAMDPSNPRILYASMWRVLRTPYSLESGGEGSSIWKSTDGGDTWSDISHNEGLPASIIGNNCVTISPVNPDRIWAIIEATNGGVFRSDDGGTTWQKVNDERKLRQRAWYYTKIYADTQSEDVVYVLNVRFWRSKDGGKSFESIRTPHGDHHDLWIAPENPERMIIGDDGGAQITYNAGEGWSTYHNQPTAQFYRVTTDNHFPYRIYGAQQDNSSVRILHRSSGRAIGERHWEATAGGESGHIAPHPINPDIVYAGSYDGFLTRLNHKTGEIRAIDVWPDEPMGHGAKDMKYRFQWNFPIFFSPHDASVLYTAGNRLFKTTDEGQSWQVISPDLTRNDSTKMGSSGGPITKDNTSVEYYGTIFAALESPHEAGVLWTGSDDGLIHLSRNGGKDWLNVTPPRKLLPEWAQINSLEPHPTEPGGLYVAATRYKSDDFRPYLLKTMDYGKSWKRITRGIGDLHFTRVIRADPGRPGLLYAGTESGIYISFDDGASWQPFQLNLPVVPITDLAVKENDLVVATQGRSFWVLDDLTPLHQLSDAVARSDFHLFRPRAAYRMRGSAAKDPVNAGKNPPNGVVFYYTFKQPPDSSAVAFKILDLDGHLIRTFTPTAKEKAQQLPLEKGMNRIVWNMRYADAEKFKNLILWAGGTQGPKAVPGTYRARLIVAADSMQVDFDIKQDPRSSSTITDLQKQFDFLIAIRDKLTEVHRTIKQIRTVRGQINDVMAKLDSTEGSKEIQQAGKAIIDRLAKIEKTLYQTKNRSRQDPLNFPIRLNNKLSALASLSGFGDYPPTDQAVAVKDELISAIDAQLTDFNEIITHGIPKFNRLVHQQAIPAVKIELEEGK